ncbi:MULTISPECIES: hypothetical protein [unclassified Polaribacter]|uniref:hypothetical protein n=1 Tax=unclassified Polaribacter TaxID=196858 RepID=UPI0016745FAF|nr:MULTISPECIES: hypothetical protein [unclassified Polaribacter]
MACFVFLLNPFKIGIVAKTRTTPAPAKTYSRSPPPIAVPIDKPIKRPPKPDKIIPQV